MKFNTVSAVEEKCWDMRLADLPRAEDRAVLLRLYNGNPPYDKDTEKENNIQVNRNNLTGPNVMSRARTQWNNAHLKTANFFTAKPNIGPVHKRAEWGMIFTRNANRPIKADRRMVELIRGQGANTLLFGIGPSTWPDRRSIIPNTVPVGSVLVPSETELQSFDSDLECIAIFREWNLAKLVEMTQGSKVDPGWNMGMVQAAFDYIKDDLRKSPNSLAFQYMPERIEELAKQDKGFLGTDAVPTVDVWDFLYRDEKKPNGVYRKVILDWSVGPELSEYKNAGTRPQSRNKVKDKEAFLYDSYPRKYANTFSEVIHFQFGDLSPYSPPKYHDQRGLGWMLWGVCDLDNQLYCKFNEALFEQCMWFFQTAGNQDLIRLKKANFEHLGVIPQGIKFLTAQERYVPNTELLKMGFDQNRQLISDSSAAFTQGYEGQDGEGRTAIETMAIVNSSQALTSGILELSYTYQKFLYMEMVRRLCLKNSTDPMAREFRKNCLRDGIPENMLEASRWDIVPEQVLGGGNKTMQMGIVQYLNSVRKNLPANGQRIVDHIGIATVTDQPEMAEEIAPIAELSTISSSMANAQDATMRLLHGLPYALPRDAIFEDYAKVWLHDLAMEIQRVNGNGGVAPPQELAGLINLGKHIAGILVEMGKNEDDKPRVKQYQDAFTGLMNHVKGFEQRLQQAMKKQQGNGAGAPPAPDPKDAAKAQAMIMQAQTKAAIAANSAQQRTAQKQQQWELGERRKDLQTVADLKREGIKTRHELMSNHLKALVE